MYPCDACVYVCIYVQVCPRLYAHVYVCIYVQVCPVRCVVAASNDLPGTTIFVSCMSLLYPQLRNSTRLVN